MDMIKGLIAGIYESKRSRECSNDGISYAHDSVTIIGEGIPEISEEDNNHPGVKLISKNGYIYAEPMKKKRRCSVGWMMGGTFIYSSDSRFPSTQPIPLHDRQEGDEYDTEGDKNNKMCHTCQIRHAHYDANQCADCMWDSKPIGAPC